jgi:acyl-homoserine lactone acylase PvdQ
MLKDKVTGWVKVGSSGTVAGLTAVFSWCFTNTASQIQHYKNTVTSLDSYYIIQDGWEIPDNLY